MVRMIRMVRMVRSLADRTCQLWPWRAARPPARRWRSPRTAPRPWGSGSGSAAGRRYTCRCWCCEGCSTSSSPGSWPPGRSIRILRTSKYQNIGNL